jgi:hypothetical protein
LSLTPGTRIGGHQIAAQIGGRASTRHVSSEVADGFTGVFLGLYAPSAGAIASSPALFDGFDYLPLIRRNMRTDGLPNAETATR